MADASHQIAPDPRLTTEQQAVVARYGMTDQRWTLSVRAKLLLTRAINTAALRPGDAPRAQQIVIVNRDELQPRLFDDT